ncbi:MAG: bifunctional glutamate N-acetyltransferase/amino-acid acetyltransferase ArgJ [Ruminococcus sp.]|jgi:glutamate N-acetyltransferase/amino-acid N-acetyltransferase|nr:bifunctional glutamate N-acetyltransferase/amino-acid acetyltransferase ArgJ [Ruminococcus sp.]
MIRKTEFENIEYVTGGICAPKGFKSSGVHAGIKEAMGGEGIPEKPDLALILSDEPCTVSGVFTQNKVKAAPVYYAIDVVKNGSARAVIANSVNANVRNRGGENAVNEIVNSLSSELKISKEFIIPASTGVIGCELPTEPIIGALPELVRNLSATGNNAALKAIMTTDTMEKEIAVTFTIDGKICHIGGMIKGSGMIHPNMATTLSFITSDVKIEKNLLDKILKETVDKTLNCVSVDGDTSTNDMCLIMANGKSDAEIKTESDANLFKTALYAVLLHLAKAMARDGEGATKLIECLTIAKNKAIAKAVSRAVISSSLVKAAIFGGDANWGRILCATGYAEGDFVTEFVGITISSEFGNIKVCENGCGLDFSEEKAAEILTSEHIFILIDLGDGGNSSYTAYGCDLSYDYVRINGDYRS